MAQVILKETLHIDGKVFFKGEAFVTDADAELIKRAQNAEPAQAEQSTGAFPKDYPGYEILGQVEGMTPELLAAMSDDEILAINGIGPATLKQIRAIK